jgi:hypothetical protein
MNAATNTVIVHRSQFGGGLILNPVNPESHPSRSSSCFHMDPDTTESKMEVARQKKATADAAFKAGNLTDGKHYVRQTPFAFH